MKKIADFAFLLLFAAFLAAALLVTALKPKDTYNYYENRTLAVCPPLSREGLSGGAYFDQMEDYLVDHAAGRETLVRAKTKADISLLRRPVVNDVVVTDTALLAFKAYADVDADAVARKAERVADDLARLRDEVESYGGHFYYIAVPCQYASLEELYPSYLNSKAAYTAVELPAFCAALAARNIELIDMGEEFDRLGGRAQFSSTVDNHYSLYGAYETWRALCGRVREVQDIDLPCPPLGDGVTLRALQNPYLGAYARKLLGLWNSGEPLYAAEFAEPVAFTREDNGVCVAATVYQMPASDTADVLYSLYMGGDIAETVIRTGRPELPTALIFGDSFTNAFESLAYYSFDEMRSLDKRHYADMSVADYVARHQPDIVVCLRDYESLLFESGNGVLFE